MAVNLYRKFKISVSEDSKKIQGLRVGDIVRRQYRDTPHLIYTLLCVIEVGADKVIVQENGADTEKKRHWFIGALLEGDAPSEHELLDFVRITNLWDANRLGAIYMTGSDEQAPYIDIIDGIAVEQSLCYPSGLNNVSWKDNFSQYNVLGGAYVTTTYQTSKADTYRICSITRNSVATVNGAFIGLSQLIDKPLANPNSVLISYKIKASKALDNLIMTLGYEDGTRFDGTVNVQATTEWAYKLHVITIDNSARYKRVLKFNINDNLTEGDTVEIADFNVILLSSVANFAGGMKVRMGKLNGVYDPVFGALEDYGAYTQRIYATKQVNIAGTLTAGDENGFGCTFYAGKIHKNAVINSIACDFASVTSIVPALDSPTGIGEVYSSDQEMLLNAQTNSWMLGKLGKRYCFSFWAKSTEACNLLISQNGYTLKVLPVDLANVWHRYWVSFDIQDPHQGDVPLQLGISPSAGTLFFTSPQIESGNYATQYQPTDDVLAYIEDYGAWFNKGGIGGTIQNPLLKLNEDGSISSRNDSFVIQHDGTGHLANGRFKWTKDEIILQGVTIKWDDLDDTTQDAIKPKSIRIIGEDVFMKEGGIFVLARLVLQIVETNFISSTSGRKWYYLGDDNRYVLFNGENGRNLTVLPDASYWGNRNTLTIKCVVTVNSVDYADTITIQKRQNGEDAYTVQVLSSNGNIFRNGIGTTVLTAHVYRGGTDITDQLRPQDFDWWKTSENSDADQVFNAAHTGYGNSLTVTSEDVRQVVQFDCKVRINLL